MIARPIEILLIQSRPLEVRRTVEALKDCRIVNRLNVVESGEEAFAFLRREESHADAPRPQLVLLDATLRGDGAMELLRGLKRDPDLRTIPVVVLTPANGGAQPHLPGSDCSVAKPLDFAKLVAILGALQDFWLDIVELPTR